MTAIRRDLLPIIASQLAHDLSDCDADEGGGYVRVDASNQVVIDGCFDFERLVERAVARLEQHGYLVMSRSVPAPPKD